MHPIRIVIAPDKFKGTLTAEEAAAAIAEGVRRCDNAAQIRLMPVADGGEGTVDALLKAGAHAHDVQVRGPLDDFTKARLVILGTTAFIESAQACGLQLLDPQPKSAVAAHSYGVGQLIESTLDAGVEEVIVGLGGVSCTDGGAGMAMALGAKLLDESQDLVSLGGGGLVQLAQIDLSELDPRLRTVSVIAACDVTNPLIGDGGAAQTYAPQKGAGPVEVADLSRALEHYAHVIERDLACAVGHLPGGGAAGGLGAGLVAFAGAQISSGCGLILAMTGLPEVLPGCDLVITGEGKLDTQSLNGKAPIGVAHLARQHGLQTIGLAGVIEEADGQLAEIFAATGSMTAHAGSERALSQPAEVLQELAHSVFDEWRTTRPPYEVGAGSRSRSPHSNGFESSGGC